MNPTSSGKRRYRTIFISDVHLGSRGARAEALARFLKQVRCEKLYLVGDIVDFWRMSNKVFWPRAHNDVLRRLLKMSKNGVEIVYIPGNHDEGLRQYEGVDFGGITLRLQDVHDLADGRRLLITHGDQYDLVIKHSRLLSAIGAWAYEWLLVVNRLYNRVRSWFGRPYWSLAQFLKLKVKSACTFVSRFEKTLLDEARRADLDGVVCGHIHHPAIETTDDDLIYYNCGDWIENCTALVEDFEGRVSIIRPLTWDGVGKAPVDEQDDLDLPIGESSADLRTELFAELTRR